jgi:hypothetical protein
MALVDAVRAHLARFHPPHLPRSRGRRQEVRWHLPVLRAITVLRWGTLAGVIYLIGWGTLYEMRTSRLEADYFTRLDSKMSVAVGQGASQAIHFPQGGPYDQRLGYAALPQFISDLPSHG